MLSIKIKEHTYHSRKSDKYSDNMTDIKFKVCNLVVIDKIRTLNPELDIDIK